ncbi:hypothetical protein AKJ63_01810 [candidate division MSBL1 archaeon SCGC-AAA259D18]|uniref:DNA primase DnaG n=1 Tax=candidate division MSBL1 archaeon SCGC-AAA259D18 TaxID=1698262 RepID=A0A133UAG9_9EURY|nr:hypothetical protein AKJ63_01810 [candidate division MSBL1 archaeon SCGC-AAA259D18]
MGDGSSTTKYLIKTSIETDGVVERPDVVGAVFGQTEGILEDDLDLRELQKNGQIGRINVNVKSEKGKSRGTISIPSGLDKKKTAMIAAALETVDRVGPCEANIEVDKIQDIKEAKRHFIKERAEELARNIEDVKGDEKLPKRKKGPSQGKNVQKYKGQPAGPTASKSDAIIIVEGRSDVINLLDHGIKNTVAIEGTSVPPVVSEITKKKTTTAFLDGDRGGDLILKELFQIADLDYVARAPDGLTVEDLSGEEVRKALKAKVPAEKVAASLGKEVQENLSTEDDIKKLAQAASNLQGTLKAQLFSGDWDMIGETEVRELSSELENSEGNVIAVVFDGVITQNLADLAAEKDLNYLVGMRERVKKEPDGLRILTPEDF